MLVDWLVGLLIIRHTMMVSYVVVQHTLGQLYPALEAMHTDPRRRKESGHLLIAALQLAGIAPHGTYQVI